ncbi:DUF2092 domain-containing protein [Paracraurococcus lichenis]|uniref:DUF2092 domain-containing protein n=1 Tax=Paracraurococcus lichenis TaxID=3064888 RepID=A0ABT9E189_9PROT|nr:DUF2092 domain-containing protein [Paracraurococcus sp. LOR1-02]MDO9709894.1 DUF2092 domain-containing protein [Paracraurococcus sp. LOR1-02]
MMGAGDAAPPRRAQQAEDTGMGSFPAAREAGLMALVLGALVAAPPALAQAPPAQPPPAQAPPAPPPAPHLSPQVTLEPRAMELLQVMCARLAAARSLGFNAVATYESPARTGHPLAYATAFQVLMQRPDRLRVLMPGDGPPSEFYYDGRRMVAFAPQEGLAAVAEAPPSIDAMLKAAFEQAAIYFPFADFIVSDPCRDLTDGLRIAFVVGQSKVVGGTTTDVLAIANDAVQGQLWIGAEDRLPRLFRATYFDDPATYRHAVAFSDWVLDRPVPADAFASVGAAQARPMPFARPDAPVRAP